MATFLANKIYTTERDITNPTTPLQIMLSLQDKTCRVIEDRDVDEQAIKGSQTLSDITRCIGKQSNLFVVQGDYQTTPKYPYLSALWRENKHGDPPFLLRF